MPAARADAAHLSMAELELLHFHRKGLSEEAVRERLRLSLPSFSSRVRCLCRKLQTVDLEGP